MTSEATHNATFSPGLDSGPAPCALPAGMTTAEFGRALAPANLSARQAKEMGLLTSGTYGLRSSTSLRSANLRSFAENRLRAALECCGATLFKLTWKDTATPSGGSVLVQRVSARRTGGSGNIGSGWPTPTATIRDNSNPESRLESRLARGRNSVPLYLGGAAELSAWTTPSARDHKDTPGMEAQRGDGKSRDDQLPRQAYLAAWPTPIANDAEKRGSVSERPGMNGLAAVSQMTGPARYTVSGQMLTGYSAGIPNGGQLNPELPRWLMGCPVAWARAAPGFADYSIWQALIQIASDAPRNTGSEP